MGKDGGDMNSFFLNVALGRLAKNPPTGDGINQLYEQYKGMLKNVKPEDLEPYKAAYPTLAPAIEIFKTKMQDIK